MGGVQPGTKETFLGAFLADILYGLYVSAFIECCALLWRKHKAPNMKQLYLMTTTGLMFVLITTTIITSTYRCVITFDTVDADIGPPNSIPGLIMNSCWLFVTPVADAFIVFRTFVVWNGSWCIVLLPMILCVVGLGSSIWNVIALTRVGGLGAGIWGNIAWEAVNTFLLVSLAINVLCTALISFRILQMRRQLFATGMVATGSGHGIRLVAVIVESAALYTLLLVATIITTRIGTFVNFVFLSLLPPTIGLVFSYIIIRVGRGTSYGDETDSPSMKSLNPWDAQRNGAPERFELSRNQNMLSSARREVQVQLEHDIHHNGDAENGFSDYILKAPV
ncbi:hypothetical protein C8F04DRAFT_1079029 [Mycena alexandri]|uniref:Uncharacterized protein n=1 Tax=Mycena alexandri TaxID=1745969 RepID=A0AAD6X9D3_9AGAR|nr:hypothetical protein C8F04DRAFT_1079029 [Mycena alexandri]